MKALFYDFSSKKFFVEQIPEPKVSPGEILIKIKSSALCGTDLHIVSGILSEKRYAQQIILGHSFSGEVVEVGKRVRGFAPGNRVFASDYIWCGRCPECRRGRQNLCDHRYVFGMEAPGSHAEFLAVPERACFRLPGEISFEDGSLICDLLATAYHAVRRADLTGAEEILVIGLGPLGAGLGLLLKALGFSKIVFCESEKSRRLWAGKIVGKKILSPNELEKTSRQFDTVFEVSGSKEALSSGFKYLKRGGKVILVGVQSEPFLLNSVKTISRETSILGSYEFDLFDVKESLRLVKQKRIDLGKLVTHRLKLEDGGKAYKLLASKKSGKVILNL